jgi:uncharacterized membrane protein YbhN (UPF0104 family)
VTSVVRILRTAAGLLVLALLIYFGRIDLAVLRQTLEHPALLLFAAALLLAAVPIAAVRWWVLIAALDFPMGFRWALQTTFISNFFNVFLPGTLGGDMVRVLLARRAAHGGMSRLAFTVMADRLSGLAALMVLALCVVPALPARFHEPAYLLPLAAACVALPGGIAVGILAGAPLANLLARLPAPLGPRLAHAVREVLAAVRAYAGRWSVLAWALALSLLQFILVLSSLIALGMAMSFDRLPPSGYVIAGVWSIIANFLPLTPGGLGVGEAAFAQIAAALESGPSGASYGNVFLAARILTILISVVGVLPYLAQRGELRKAALAGAAEPSAGESGGN